jgi:hypothetical protein
MSSKDVTQSKKPANTAFKQQRLKAWQPILTPKPVIISFLVIGIVFIPIGIGIVISSNEVVEVDVRYDQLCDVGQVCNITLDIPQNMKAPVYLYYRLDNYYQNHRRYVKSRNDNQLRGSVPLAYSDLSDCDPYISSGGSQDDPPEKFYFPCGLIARSVFNDTFFLFNETGEPIMLRKDGIAWESDREKKFKNPPPGSPGIRVIPDLEDEDFIVWMRTAGLPDFKKLYRIIDGDILQGKYNVTIYSRYPVSSFDGKKHVVLSTTTWIGGKNPFLGYAYIVVGAICFVQGVVFGLKHHFSPRKLGDTKYLEWNK